MKIDIRGLDVPSAQVKLDDGDEAFQRVIDGRHWEKSLGVGHEAGSHRSVGSLARVPKARLLRDPLQHGPGLKDEGGQDDPAQVGTRSELRNDVREDCGSQLVGVHGGSQQDIPFPWSGSTTSSSPLAVSGLGSSSDERVPEMPKKEPQSADMMEGKGGKRERKNKRGYGVERRKMERSGGGWLGEKESCPPERG